jgi:hypothetical protein
VPPPGTTPRQHATIQQNAPTVFISYSHKDEDWKDRLLEHLGVLEEEGLLKTWNDRNIGAGDEWLEEIQGAMNAARVAVFLVSAASLKSKFIRHKEIPHLLDRREKEGMTFIPVIVRSCVWDELPWLSRFQARPQDGKPLADFKGNRRDAELAKIAKEILGIVRNGVWPSTPPRPAAVAISSTFPASSPSASPTGRPQGASWHEDLEVVLTRHDEDFIGCMPAYSSTARFQTPSHTTLMGYLSDIEIINHSKTAPTEVISMRFGFFDPATEDEIKPVKTLKLRLLPETRDQRRMSPVDRRTFSFNSAVIFSGCLDRATLPGRLFLMIKVIGMRDELKVRLKKSFFLLPDH